MSAGGVNYGASSSNAGFNALFEQIKTKQIQNLTQLQSYTQIDTINDLVSYLLAGLQQTNNKSVIPQLLNIAKVHPELHERLISICKTQNLLSGQASTSVTKSFTSLENILPDPIEIAPNVFSIDCFQQNTLPGGAETCGVHSFKNAIAASIAAKDGVIPTNIFISSDQYEKMAAFVARIRGLPEKDGDASVTHLREAWKAYGREESLSSRNTLTEKDVSFFDTTWNQLTLPDAESLKSLANLKSLKQHPGPCHHAIMIGVEGHWVTLMYEKDPEGKERWYGFDSIDKEAGNFYVLEAVRKLNEGLAHLDSLVPKLYYQTMGESLEQLVLKIEQEKEILHKTSEENVSHLTTAVEFMKTMGWFDPTAIRTPLMEHWIHSLQQLCAFYQIHQEENWPPVQLLDPFSYQLALLTSGGADIKIKALTDSSLTEGQQLQLFEQLNALPDDERSKLSEQVLQLIGSGYVELFTQEDFVNRWPNILNLLMMKVLPLPTSDPVVVSMFMEVYKSSGASLIEALNVWMQDPAQAGIKQTIILTLEHELEHNPNPHQVRHLLALCERNIFLFVPVSGSFEKTLRDMKNLTAEGALSLFHNPYRVYRELQALRKTQSPKRLIFEHEGAGYFFIPSIREEIFRRGDIPPGLTLDTFNRLFNATTHRMREDLGYARHVHAVLSEKDQECSLDECLVMLNRIKNSFFNDAYMHFIMQLPESLDAKIPAGSFRLYSLLNYWLSLDTELSRENPLGDQTLTLLSYAKELDGCQTGRDQKVNGEYSKVRQYKSEALLPHPEIENATQSDSDVAIEHRLLTLFQEMYSNYRAKAISIISQDVFINDFLNFPVGTKIPDSMHITLFIINKFGPLIGLQQELVFDRSTNTLNVRAFTRTERLFMTAFLQHAAPILKELPILLNEQMMKINDLITENDSLMQLVVQYKKAKMEGNVDQQEALKQQIESRSQQEKGSIYERVDLESTQSLFSLSQDIINLLESRKIRSEKVLEKKFRPNADEIFEREDYKPGDETIQFIHEKGRVHLLEALEVIQTRSLFKLDPAQPMPLNAIKKIVENDQPIVIDLSDCTWLTAEDIFQIVRAAPCKELRLNGCTQLTNVDIILKGCEENTVVDLSECTQLSRVTVPIYPTLILHNCRPILGLFSVVRNTGKEPILTSPLESGKKYTREEVARSFIGTHPNSVSEYLEPLGFSPQEAIDFCIKHQLATVDLIGFKNSINSDHLHTLLRENKNIQSLSLNSQLDLDTYISCIKECSQLTSISLVNAKISDAFVATMIDCCSRLSSIKLTSAHLSDISVEAIASAYRDQLTFIYLVSDQIANASVEKMATLCPNLTEINIVNCKMTMFLLDEITSHCRNLEKINLARFRIGDITDDEIIAITSKLPNLRKIEGMKYHKRITADSIKTIVRQCLKLMDLELHGCRESVNDAFIQDIAPYCSNLETIELWECKITLESIRALAQHCPKLTKLDLSQFHIAIDDAFIEEVIPRFPNLKHLELNNCFNITDKSLQVIAHNCPHIMIIEIRNCKKITLQNQLELSFLCPSLSKILN